MEERGFQLHAGSPRLLNEIRQHDDVADNHAGQTDNREHGHEAERSMEKRQTGKGANQAQRNGQHDHEGFGRGMELEHHRQHDEGERDEHHPAHFPAALRHFAGLSPILQMIARGQLHPVNRGPGPFQHLGGQTPGWGVGFYGDGALMVEMSNGGVFQLWLEGGNLAERHQFLLG